MAKRTILELPDDGGLWQVKSKIVTVPGTTTTVYAAVDAVGVPFVVPDVGGPNNCMIILNAIALFDVVPTTSSTSTSLLFFNGSVAAGTDSAIVAITDLELFSLVGVLNVTLGGGQSLFTNNAYGVAANTAANAGLYIPTAQDGSLIVQAVANGGFTLGAAGSLHYKLIYRYANFSGIA